MSARDSDGGGASQSRTLVEFLRSKVPCGCTSFTQAVEKQLYAELSTWTDVDKEGLGAVDENCAQQLVTLLAVACRTSAWQEALVTANLLFKVAEHGAQCLVAQAKGEWTELVTTVAAYGEELQQLATDVSGQISSQVESSAGKLELL
eukprot:CAMPEP_0178463066 /NCGR_PEP_ID=MMETSP0689_2-20121128/50143_1 /TAXON_ID=160604 /ORGANISM="Amphidinium massartii, Strain CS-259" /LENGTH=147 /DNA_ID=CAMNT_0020089941 /DNA_START=11 /DNA_END=451 /DNA_ORIENTATION=+